MSRLLLIFLLLVGAMGDGWAAEEHGASHWSYEEQESASHGGMLSQAYMACEAALTNRRSILRCRAMRSDRSNWSSTINLVLCERWTTAIRSW